MKQLRNIVFDFGGVLIDWNPEYLYGKVFKERTEMEYFLTTSVPIRGMCCRMPGVRLQLQLPRRAGVS